MDFSFSEEQEAVRDLADRIFTDLSTQERLREMETEADGDRFDRKLWSELAAAGLLGIALPEDVGGAGLGFLRCSTDHHNVAVVESPVPLLQHYSWECDDVDHVGHTATALYRADPERNAWGMGRHFAGSNFYWYLRDPSGSFLELFSDLDQILDDEAWESTGRTEFALEHVANAWGPNLPVEFIVPADLDVVRLGWERWPS